MICGVSTYLQSRANLTRMTNFILSYVSLKQLYQNKIELNCLSVCGVVFFRKNIICVLVLVAFIFFCYKK